jgi:hypothetical protein
LRQRPRFCNRSPKFAHNAQSAGLEKNILDGHLKKQARTRSITDGRSHSNGSFFSNWHNDCSGFAYQLTHRLAFSAVGVARTYLFIFRTEQKRQAQSIHDRLLRLHPSAAAAVRARKLMT